MTAAAPDFSAPLEGWRAWRLGGDSRTARLLSVVEDTPWPIRRELAADCRKRSLFPRFRRRSQHSAPAERCECGIYATRLEQLAGYLDERYWLGSRYVFGRVRLWGTVIECERGWRASRAYPSRIFVPSLGGRRRAAAPTEEIAEALRGYGVPVVVLPLAPREAIDALEQEPRRIESLY